jgi:hypothetical protein
VFVDAAGPRRLFANLIMFQRIAETAVLSTGRSSGGWPTFNLGMLRVTPEAYFMGNYSPHHRDALTRRILTRVRTQSASALLPPRSAVVSDDDPAFAFPTGLLSSKIQNCGTSWHHASLMTPRERDHFYSSDRSTIARRCSTSSTKPPDPPPRGALCPPTPHPSADQHDPRGAWVPHWSVQHAIRPTYSRAALYFTLGQER